MNEEITLTDWLFSWTFVEQVIVVALICGAILYFTRRK